MGFLSKISRNFSQQKKEKDGETSQPSDGLVTLIDRPEDMAGCVDIIAIHGLNGHPKNTWTHARTGLNWLSDERGLAKDIPNARIMTFGYNSRTYFSRSKAAVPDFASILLADVQANRRTRQERSRPIVFICHSLGGLVFKQAVILAHERDQHYSDILRSIRGVAFFGTPHRGSKLAFWDTIGLSLVQIGSFGYVANARLSRDLNVDAAMLSRISDSFASRGAQFKIRTFFETEPMDGLNCLVVQGDSAKLGWPNELAISAGAHHSGMCKFADPSEPRYKRTAAQIAQLVNDTEDEDDYSMNIRDEDSFKKLNQDYLEHLENVDKAVSGTCTWLLSHREWDRWSMTRRPALLWITASPGCGKSVLAKFLYSSLSLDDNAFPPRHVCYYFFMDGFKYEDSVSMAVSALLHQLCSSQPRLIRHVKAVLSKRTEHVFNRLPSLWSILMEVMSDPAMQDVIWIVDGLDQCEKTRVGALLKCITEYLAKDSWASRTHLKIILLSRRHNVIQHALGLGGNDELDSTVDGAEAGCSNLMRIMLEMESKATAADIELFVQHQVEGLRQHHPGLTQETLSWLREKLIADADYTFLWISLVIRLLTDAGDDGMSRRRLESVINQGSLDDLYAFMLSGSTDPNKARRVLEIVLAAARPLSLAELCVAAEVHQENASPEVESSPLQDNVTPHKSLAELEEALYTPFESHILAICGHFLRTRDGRIHLVHQTARDFLLGANSDQTTHSRFAQVPSQHGHTSLLSEGVNRSRNAPSASCDIKSQWHHSIRLEDANVYLLRVCVDYLQLLRDDVPDMLIDHTGPNGHGFYDWIFQNPKRAEAIVAGYLDKCRSSPPRALFQYAASHWADHYRPVRPSNSSFDSLFWNHEDHNLCTVLAVVYRRWADLGLTAVSGISIHAGANDETRSSELLWYYTELKHEEVLDYFDLNLDEDMTEYDRQFVDGERYWKETGLHKDALDTASDKMPSRVAYFRHKYQQEQRRRGKDARAGMSPASANPTSFDATWASEQKRAQYKILAVGPLQ